MGSESDMPCVHPTPLLESWESWDGRFWPRSLFPLLQNWANDNSTLTELLPFSGRVSETPRLVPGPQWVLRALEFPPRIVSACVLNAAQMAGMWREWLVLRPELSKATRHFITFQKY